MNNTPIANKNISFIINNVHHIAQTDNNGVASVNLDLIPSKYDIGVYFEGDGVYQNSSLKSTIEILPTVKANDMVKYYKANVPFSAQFLDSFGNPLTNAVVTITVNGKSYPLKTDNNGFAHLQINLKPGSYNVISTDPLTGYKLTTTFTVLSTITSTNTKQVAGQNKRFTVTFLKSNGNPLSKQYVKYKFKGKIHKVKTNSKGHISLSLKKFKKGSYKIICYNKDGLKKSFSIKIYKRKAFTSLHAQSYIFLPNDNRQVKIRLSTSLGDSSNAGKLIKVKINGVTYSGVTDGDGVASVNLYSLNKGIYNVVYSYGGNKFFKSSKTTGSITIFDTTQTTLSPVSTTHFGYGAGTSLKLAYSAGGVPLSGKDVILTVDGKNYIKTTDKSGIVYLPINLKIGSYTVSYKTNDDSIFRGVSGSFNIDVFERSSSKIIWKSGSSYKDNSQIFTILVTNLNGEPVSGGEIQLTIDGESYTANVESNGYARFKTEVPIGSYKVSVNFKGDNNYLSSSMSHYIDVDVSKFAKGINEKNAHASKVFLKSSSHCKVGAKSIKKLVKSLTKGLTSNVNKAKALFNYVRDTLDYSYYYNSRYGSTKTLKYKKGNCVDHSHLLVAMFRTAGFNARYVHGKCHFKSGDVTGHVWTQVKIGNKWICADAISYRNSLGKIKNWNTGNYILRGKYASLPF